MSIEKKVKEFSRKHNLINEGDRILLGLSGGADSVCLFYLLLGLRAELGFELRTVHVHHGIRPEAEKDVSYVTKLCEREKVFCYVFREDVPVYAREQGLGEEEAGRLLRYQAFEKALNRWKEEVCEEKVSAADAFDREIASDGFKIATAHHENDQAETVLFQLFRGCGLAGLRGILPKRGHIIRPVLCLSREETEFYLKEKGISWCEDKTNMLGNYSRNKIRHQLLPYAETEICKGAVSHIGKTAEIMREAECYIKEQAKAAYDKISAHKEGMLVFDIDSLRQEDIFLQKQILLYGMEKMSASRKDIGAVHVEDILKLMQKQGNGGLYLPDGLRVQKCYQSLLLFEKNEEQKGMTAKCWLREQYFLFGDKKPVLEAERILLSDEEAVKKRFGIQNISEIMKCIPQKTYTKWFDYDKIKTSFQLRHRESGDYLTIDGEMNRKSFRRYLIEKKVPASCRENIWLLADGAHIMWVPGGRMSMYYKVTERTETILQIKICMEK